MGPAGSFPFTDELLEDREFVTKCLVCVKAVEVYDDGMVLQAKSEIEAMYIDDDLKYWNGETFVVSFSSASVLPTATFSAISKRSSSQQRSPSPIKSSFAPRSRAGILAQQHNVPSTDKSDASSVFSTSRSSRSSRVPPVPLITAVPDSPSVKVSRESSKDLYKTRPPSMARVMDSRMCQPPSGTLVPPSSRPSMPASLRGDSPTGSSTGDSSSGLGAPFTPRDGSDIGMHAGRRDESDVDSALKARGPNAKQSTVSFKDDPPRGRERVKNDAADEEKWNERRRSEARSAIEFGKIVGVGTPPAGGGTGGCLPPFVEATPASVCQRQAHCQPRQSIVNGRGPIVHNGSDDDLVPQHGQRMSINPTMGMDGTVPGMNALPRPVGLSMSPRSSYMSAGQGVPNNAVSAYGGGPRQRAKTGASQPSNLQLQTPGRNPGRKAAPPSSWKNV
ncbi:hypothetical protein EV424DRAFT_1643501 [Suillus variegatus]|nr:hypothetical protein EV424DRAFT_1643501 [Suillus variegatus]